MEITIASYLKFVVALVFVLGLIGAFAILAKKLGLGHRGPIARGSTKRLEILEALPLDAKRRLVLVRRDDREHLLLLGADSATVVETDISRADGTAEASGSVTQLRLPSAQVQS